MKVWPLSIYQSDLNLQDPYGGWQRMDQAAMSEANMHLYAMYGMVLIKRMMAIR